jgi:hypothetical protein
VPRHASHRESGEKSRWEADLALAAKTDAQAAGEVKPQATLPASLYSRLADIVAPPIQKAASR